MSKQCFGYIRVSTVKQGQQGVSLQEQREAISRYAERSGIVIVEWFEEIETAAKRGRPIFNRMLSLLRKGKAQGIVIHKIDRGARNLKDWSDLGTLIDGGHEVHFVNESLDMTSRGGRLSADIQAVVAADFIRNLREETRKGFYGRLKQGLYPLPAPLGYLDQGKGQAKTIDPVKAPLVRKAFELYGSGQYNLDVLGEELFAIGLRNKNGRRVSRNGLSRLLNNPFYVGLIRIHKTAETFVGAHPPLVPKSLWDRVRLVLLGKTNCRSLRHDFLFRRLLACATCEYSLIGERQKGHVYYRCHSDECRKTSVREEDAEAKVLVELESLRFNDEEKAALEKSVTMLRSNWIEQDEAERKSLDMRMGQMKDRLNRLTDALLDGLIDKPMFEERKSALLLEQKSLEENLGELSRKGGKFRDKRVEYLELASRAWLSYQLGLADEKRDLVKSVTSNRLVLGKNLDVRLSNPFRAIANREKNTCGDPYRDIPRTFDLLLHTLDAMNKRGELPELNINLDCQRNAAADGDDDTTLAD